MSLQIAIHAQQRRWIEVEGPPAPTAPFETGLRSPPRPERYRVVSCRAADGGTTTVLAREGLGRQALESLVRRGTAPAEAAR